MGEPLVPVSVTSIRTVRVAGVAVMRTWKSRPATCPCRTALAHSSAATSVTVSCASLSYGTPQASRQCSHMRRARRAPRGVEVKRIENWCTVRGDCVTFMHSRWRPVA